jgi:hypothetical protein
VCAWGVANLPVEVTTSIDMQIRKGNHVARAAAVGCLRDAWQRAVGSPGTLVVANRSGMQENGDDVGAYTTLSDMVKDMLSPEYKASEQFRQQVQRKLAANPRQ